MNLLDKNWYWLLLAAFIIFSCDDPNEIGVGLNPDGVESSIFYKEIILPTENIFIDSLRTSDGTSMTAGKMSSETFGTVTSTAYGKLFFNSTVKSLSTSVDDVTSTSYIIDTAVLTLQYDYLTSPDIVTSDTTQSLAPQTFYLSELNEHIFSSTVVNGFISGVYYLADNETPTLEVEEGHEFTITPRVDSLINSTSDTVQLWLNDSWKERLFNIIADREGTEPLSDYFKGISLSPAESNDMLINFSTAGFSSLDIDYRIVGPGINQSDSVYDSLTVSLKFQSSLSSGGLERGKYNKVSVDRTGSSIGNNIGEHLAVFETNDNLVYLNAISGIYPKVDLSELFDFIRSEEQELIQINNLEFELLSLEDSTALDKREEEFNFYLVGDNRKLNTEGILSNFLFETAILSNNGYLSSTQSKMGLVNDSLDYYSDDATIFSLYFKEEFILEEEEDTEIRDEAILIPNNLNSISQTVFPVEGVKAKIYYSQPN